MRYLPQFLTRWWNRKKETPWTRETPWRQGSVLPSPQAVALGLIDMAQSSRQIAVVVSHDCDLAAEIEGEPNVELIVGSLIASCGSDKTHAKNVRVLHIEISVQGGPRAALELVAKNKLSVRKAKMSSFGPDAAYSIDRQELGTLRSWLAARYRRASIPDGLQDLVRNIFQDSAEKGDKPKAVRGIWIDFEPDSDQLEVGEKYELWVAVVYSTSVANSKSVAEQTAKQIQTKLEKKCRKNGVWSGLELRQCVARSDTEFTYYETYKYRLFRLEHLSIRAQAASEIGNE